MPMKDAAELLRADEARSLRVQAALKASARSPHNAAPASGIVAKAGGVPFPFDRVDMLSSNPREQLTQPYKNSVWVMRAIKKISGPISAVPLEVTDAATGKPIDDPALSLFLRSPVKGLDAADFAEAGVGWLKLAGETFLIGDDTWLLPFAKTRNTQLLMPRPDQMRHVVAGGEIIGWEYRDPKMGKQLLLPEQVWHKKLWNPYDPWRGLSEYEAARIATEGDYFAGEFVRNLMANNGDQGVYLVAKNGVPDDAQRAQIIADLREKRARAQKGEFRAVFLTGDIEVQDPKITAPDAALISNRLENRHEIYIAFGVPASMADVKAAYSIGSASDRFELIEETCIPTGAKLSALLAGPASMLVGRDVALRHNWDEHSTMQAVRRERLDAAQKLWTSGWPWKSINDYLRLGMKPFAGWDVPYIPIGVMPLDASGVSLETPESSPDFSEPDDDEADLEEKMNAMERALERGALRRPRPVAKQLPAADWSAQLAQSEAKWGKYAPFCGCTAHGTAPIPDGEIRARDPKRVLLARRHLRSRLPMIKQYRSRITRELMAARVDTLKRIEKHRSSIDAAAAAKKSGGSQVQRAAAADLVFEKQSFGARLFAALRKQAALALDDASDQVYSEVGRDDPYQFPAESVLDYARRRENVMSNVPDEIHRSILDEIEEGLVKGDTTDELADRVKQAFNGIADGRARTIASTEVSAAYGFGRHTAMKKAGIRRKSWLTSGNDNVRPAHAEAEGQSVPIDEPFEVGGEELQYPGDDHGSPENVINCHCVSIAEPDTEEDDE